MRNVEPGMKFVYKSKYNDEFYIGIVDRVLIKIPTLETSEDIPDMFVSDKGVHYKSDEVEWLDEIRDRKLKELGL